MQLGAFSNPRPVTLDPRRSTLDPRQKGKLFTPKFKAYILPLLTFWRETTVKSVSTPSTPGVRLGHNELTDSSYDRHATSNTGTSIAWLENRKSMGSTKNASKVNPTAIGDGKALGRPEVHLSARGLGTATLTNQHGGPCIRCWCGNDQVRYLAMFLLCFTWSYYPNS